MSSQNSNKEKPTTIYFSPTGGNLPPIEEKNIGKGSSMTDEKMQQCTGTMEYKEIEEDMVNHPKHYTSHPSGVECIEITRHYCFSIGNAIKYLWRAGLKKEASLSDKEKEIEDLEKAIWYINDRINELKK